MTQSLIHEAESRILAQFLINTIDAEEAEWKREHQAVKAAAEYTCERCARPCYQPGEEIADRRHILTSCRAENHPDRPLVAWCIPCHLKINAVAFRQRSLWRTRQRHGQLALSEAGGCHV